MYSDNLKILSEMARSKAEVCRRKPHAFLLQSVLGGAYVGLGIVLAFALASPVHSAKLPFAPLVMAFGFGISLALVMMSDAELCSTHSLLAPVGVRMRVLSPAVAGKMIGLSLLGNLIGSFAVAVIVYLSGLFQSDPALVLSVSAKKMTAGPIALLMRGFLCNWLLMLGVWCALRMKSEGGRLMIIGWTSFAVIGSGLDYGVANMTLLTLGKFLGPAAGVSWKGWFHNLAPVLLGNFLSAAIFVALPYIFLTKTWEGRVTIPSGPKAHPQPKAQVRTHPPAAAPTAAAEPAQPMEFQDQFNTQLQTQMSRPMGQAQNAEPPAKAAPYSGQTKIGNPRAAG